MNLSGPAREFLTVLVRHAGGQRPRRGQGLDQGALGFLGQDQTSQTALGVRQSGGDREHVQRLELEGAPGVRREWGVTGLAEFGHIGLDVSGR